MNKVVKFQSFDSSYFRGKSYFEDDGTQTFSVSASFYHFEDNGTQNFTVLQPVLIYFKEMLITTIFQDGNQKDCLMKVLNLLLQLTIISLPH